MDDFGISIFEHSESTYLLLFYNMCVLNVQFWKVVDTSGIRLCCFLHLVSIKKCVSKCKLRCDKTGHASGQLMNMYLPSEKLQTSLSYFKERMPDRADDYSFK